MLGRLPPGDDPGDDDAQARFRLLDGIVQRLEAVARRRPVMVALDDLQWADASSLALFELLSRKPPGRLLLAGSYRHDELTEAASKRLTALAVGSCHVHLTGLTEEEVAELLQAAGGDRAASVAAEVHRRSAGHPFFVRELAQLLGSEPTAEALTVPAVVRDVIRHRLARLSPTARETLATATAAVSGNDIDVALLAVAMGADEAATVERLAEARALGVIVAEPGRFAHDLYREVIEGDLDPTTRTACHLALADALERRGRHSDATAVARHLTAAVAIDNPGRAARWASVAADLERRRLAFAEAAGHLQRARAAIESLPGGTPFAIDLLVEEGDTWARGGEVARGRRLLATAAELAEAIGDALRVAAVALGQQRLGARFAMPRDEVVRSLERARRAVAGADLVLEAKLTAALSRELCHSVPQERPRALPLSERALAIARELDDPVTLADCLLARHDVLWSPGRAAERLPIAREIGALASSVGDEERRAQGLLLTASALLELGDPLCRIEIDRYIALVEQLGQPRHRYYALTRRAAVALLDGRIAEGEALVEEAYAHGNAIGEPDAGNVRLSQMLEVVRVEADPDRLRATADEAVRWWVGIPSHAHAVAAGFLALAGDLAGAERALRTVKARGSWRDDRSYMRSAFIGPLTIAATRLRDEELCRELLAELEPVTMASGVSGAFVVFTGSSAHWAGIACAALGRTADAEHHLRHALAVHERLGAHGWVATTAAALADLRPEATPTATWRRDGDVWDISFGGKTTRLRNAKGLADLAVLLATPGRDVHVLTLAGARELRAAGHPARILDDDARRAYHRRLRELASSIDEATDRGDARARERLEADRDALLDELRRATGLGGRGRSLGADPGERARKAVSARVRDAVRRVASRNADLGRHLDDSLVTGMLCRYEPTEPARWDVRT